MPFTPSHAVVALPFIRTPLVPAAVAIGAGLVSWRDAVHELAELGPTVAILAAVLLLAYLADEAGVFRYAGATAARWSDSDLRCAVTTIS